jgi:hypothetical protein
VLGDRLGVVRRVLERNVGVRAVADHERDTREIVDRGASTAAKPRSGSTSDEAAADDCSRNVRREVMAKT